MVTFLLFMYHLCTVYMTIREMNSKKKKTKGE